ncbi:homoserine kinase [Parachitinimonas caeni]|uniref:Homoserine kinase n=1 Tax=Parachitinimonas caeni TaxID=3031301 RepID=A0ABT7E0M0_9NEIS|nr:homoserine kinase [Parachitinimonas caeni]MDK2124975.1 homoserine kinase [Parachitinimonas caeni]
MSVYTPITPDQLREWLKSYSIGQLQALQGIASGITNTNYFVSTTHGRYVLTLFEVLKQHELPFYVNLLAHLAHHGIAVAAPIANLRDEYIDELGGKPTCMVTCLPGDVAEDPTPEQCEAVGAMLAEMHLAAQTYPARMANPRGPEWWNRTAPQIYPHMNSADAAQLRAEVQFQTKHRFTHLPSGVIHADLFRDNVLMNGQKIGGFIDFYYACNDVLIYDVAITLNDWCSLPDGDIDATKARALLSGYQSIRPFTPDEHEAWHVMLRAAALRFWVSRLYDFYKPQAGELTYTKDPAYFQRIISQHANRQPDQLWL